MASIIERKGKYCVVYPFDTETGERKQKWEIFKTLSEAKRRKAEVEYRQELGNLVVPKCKTLNELLNEYVSLYGKSVWSMAIHASNTGLIRNYISPMLGEMPLNEITARVLEKYYATLLTTKAVARITDSPYKKTKNYVAIPTIRKIHSLLRSAFTQAVKWDLIEKNPATYATVPKQEEKKRDIWDAPTLFHAIEICKDERLKLCMNLSFSCSLRLGELLGLTWDCVDISEETMLRDRASIFINKELQRVRKDSMKALGNKDIIAVFPESTQKNSTALVLKKPKTPSSIRKVFLPRTVAEMLIKRKEEVDATRLALGDEYADYNLVITGRLGTPTEGARIEKALNELIAANDLPKVVFHSLRHSSITYKLKLNGGDIKAVQGDSGHAQAKMVTDQYSHILDESRVSNAHLLEEAFYGRRGSEASMVTHPASEKKADPVVQQLEASGMDAAALVQILSNPEMVNMLKMLSKTLGRNKE